MRNLLRTLAVSALLFGFAPAAHAQISLGFQIGEPPAPRGYRVPPQPAGNYEWIEGYWYPQGSQYLWHNGYWTRPPYEGAYWVAPYHVGGRYYAGQWEGQRGNVSHNHGWDKSRQRDERHDPHGDDRNNGNGNGRGR